MKSLNLKLALSLVIGLVLVTVGVFFVHKYQVQRRSVRSLAEAKEKYAEKEYKDALGAIQRYRYYNARDKEAMQLQVKIAAERFELLKKEKDPAKVSREDLIDAYRDLAASYHEYFLKYEGTSDDVNTHKDYLDFALTPGLPNITIANQEISQLKRLKYQSPEFSFQQAQLLEGKNELSAAAALYAEIVGYNIEAKTFDPAISAEAKKMEAYFRLAACLSQLRRATDEDLAVIKEMQARHPEVARAQLLTYAFLASRPGAVDDARKAIDTAFVLDRNDPDIQNAIYERYMNDGELKKAQEVANLMRESDAKNPRRFLFQAQSLAQQGKILDALKVIDEGLREQKDEPQLLNYKITLQIAAVQSSKDQQKDLKEVRKTWTTYRDVVLKSFPAHLGKMKFIDARLTSFEGRSKAAIEIAKNAKEFIPDPTESVKVDAFIGTCYARLNQLEESRKVFELIDTNIANVRDPQVYFEVKLSLANIYLKTNKRRESIAKLEQLRAIVKPDAFFKFRELWKPLMVAWITEEQLKPEEKRDWTKIDKYLEQALAQPEEVISADEKAVLQADIMMSKGNIDKALEQALKIREKDPNQVESWIRWAQLVYKKDDLETIVAGLATAPESVKASPRMIQITAGAYQKIGGDRAAKALDQLIADSQKRTPKEQVDTLIIVGESRLRAGNIEGAKANFRAAQKVAEQYKLNDLRPFDFLLAIARESVDVAEMQSLVKEIKSVKNIPETVFQITSAQQLLVQIKDSVRKRFKENQTTLELTAEEKAWLTEAVALLDKIQAARPDWNEGYVMRAEVAAFQSNIPEQISNLRIAFDKGGLNPLRSRQLAELLQATGNATEANRVIETISGRTPDDGTMMKLKISNLLSLGKIDEAKPLVENIKLDLEKASIEDIFWFSNANRMVKNFDKSIELSRSIISKDPDLKLTTVWPILIKTYVDKGDREGAKAAILEIFNKPASELRELVAATCAEVMGEFKLAVTYYDQAVASYPESLRIRRQVVEFNIRNGQTEAARQAAENVAIILQKKPDDPLAKETARWLVLAKATIIAKSNPSYDTFLQADKLLADAIKEGDKSSIPELTSRVQLLADRPEPESIRKAIELMEKLRALNQDLPVAQQLTLGDLHQRAGNWPKAKEIMDSLVTATKDDPIVGIAYAEMLVRNGDELTAKQMLDKYLVVLPDQKEKLATLRASILIKLNDTEAGYRTLSEWLGTGPYKTKEDVDKLTKVAELLETLNQTSEARKYFLEWSKIDSVGKTMYARFVGRHDDMARGLALFEDAGKDKRVLPYCVQGAHSVIRFNKNKLASDGQSMLEQYNQAVDRWIEAMRLMTPDSVQVGILKAEASELRGNLAETASIYRGLLQNQKLDPKFRAQLNNNLAYMIAIQNDTASMPEAHQLIESAIKTYGPDSDVLDTRGTLNLFEKKYELALQDFKDAVLVPTHLKYFHLALANYYLGYMSPAREAMAKAQSLNFEPRDLNTEEFKLYEEMKKGLSTDQAAINAN